MRRENLTALTAVVLIVLAGSGCGGKSETKTERETEAAHDQTKAGEEKPGEEKKGEEKRAEGKDRVKLSPEALKNAGIKTALAAAQALADTIAVTATISHNQDRLFHVTPRITGRVVDLRVSIGSAVKTFWRCWIARNSARPKRNISKRKRSWSWRRQAMSGRKVSSTRK